jgi:arylsulfatase A
MMRGKLILGGLLLGGSLNEGFPQTQSGPQIPLQPNIIIILADDLGYGDLSCYGQTRFTTPCIDQLAKSGLLFAQHYAGCTVSAPSRSALLTGQHTGHTPIRGNKEWNTEGQWPMPDKQITLAELLKQAGYITGAFGKWGLGYPGSEGDPTNQGFDEFFGYDCQRLAHNYYPYHLWHNHEKINLNGNAGNKKGIYAPDLIHQKALEFIEKNKDSRFFLYYASVIPHAELVAPDKYMSKFSGKYLPEKEYKGTDSGKGFRDGAYGSQLQAHAAFAAMINVLDDQVGELLKALERFGIDKNTLVIFSSDNGPHLEGGADPDYFNSNGPFKGYKRDLYEGGIRVPMIIYWPERILPGRVSEHISAFWDILPTCAELAGVDVPSDIDGISLLPTLLGKRQLQHEYLYWEFHELGGRIAIRKGKWKAVKYNNDIDPQGHIELYNLNTDPGETLNLAQKRTDIAKHLEKLMKLARTPSEVFDQFSPVISK